MDTKSRVRVISLVLFFTVFAVWVLFYFIISHYIAANTEKQMTLAADQIIERLSGEFSLAERLSYSLKQNTDVQAFLCAQDRRGFFALAGTIDGLADTEAGQADFIDSIVLYGADTHYYRLSGRLGNKACSRLYDMISSLELPYHLSAELDNKKYIGYADNIPLDGSDTMGAVVILIEEEKILEVLRAYDQSGSLLVAVHAGGEVITANTGETDFIDPEYHTWPVVRSVLGITPYEISVTADPQYRNTSVVYFTVMAVITAAIFAVVLFLYVRLLNRRFFRPMVSVVGSIKQLQTGIDTESLPHVQSVEFDDLIDKINEMLSHIETKNAEVRAAELRAKNAEIERQKALVFSLKKQINAHFTVNTLEAIRTLVEQGNLEQAETVMSGLMRLVRYAHDKEELIGVWDELDVLKYYAAIMSSRYGGKLEAQFDFDDLLMEYSMPRMLLQPIMENAIQHGFKDMDAGCVITVKAELRGETMVFSVSDNGCGMSRDALAALEERLGITADPVRGFENIALVNIENRLYHYYGDRARMTIKPNEDRGLKVVIEMPPSGGMGGPL